MSVLLLLAAQAASPASQEPEPEYYICQAAPKSGAFGKIWYWMEVPVDGSKRWHRIQWHIPDRAQGLDLYVQADTWDPVSDVFGDRSTVHVKFQTKLRLREEVRIEIRRTSDRRYPGQFAYAGPFQRPFRWPDSDIYYVEAEARWDELNVWMKGRDALTFALVKRDGTVVTEDRLEATTLAGAALGIAAARPEVEAMAADYRNKCEVPQPIVI